MILVEQDRCRAGGGGVGQGDGGGGPERVGSGAAEELPPVADPRAAGQQVEEKRTAARPPWQCSSSRCAGPMRRTASTASSAISPPSRPDRNGPEQVGRRLGPGARAEQRPNHPRRAARPRPARRCAGAGRGQAGGVGGELVTARPPPDAQPLQRHFRP